MLKVIVAIALLLSAAVAADTKPVGDGVDNPKPHSLTLSQCSSESYHKMGKCGDASHGYMPCPKGYSCSKYG